MKCVNSSLQRKILALAYEHRVNGKPEVIRTMTRVVSVRNADLYRAEILAFIFGLEPDDDHFRRVESDGGHPNNGTRYRNLKFKENTDRNKVEAARSSMCRSLRSLKSRGLIVSHRNGLNLTSKGIECAERLLAKKHS